MRKAQEPPGIGDFGEAGMPARGLPGPIVVAGGLDECLIHAFSTLVGGPAVRHVLLGAWLAMAAVMTTGCGGGSTDGLPRQAVSGEVKLDGQPLADGMITFIPAGIEGPPVGAPIEAGAFSVPTRDGPIPGSHRVEVYRRKPTGRTTQDPSDPTMPIEEQYETIPDRYNVKSELKADVVAGGDNSFMFDLTGEIKSPPRRAPPSVDRRPARHALPTHRGGGVRSGPRG